jgi:hypothetical protein
MASEPCPQGDGGLCSIPERTLVAAGDRLEVWSRDEIVREFPGLDLEGPLEPAPNLESLRKAFQLMNDPEELDRFVQSMADQDTSVDAADHWRSAKARREATALTKYLASTREGGRRVFVFCNPCRHTFTKRVP